METQSLEMVLNEIRTALERDDYPAATKVLEGLLAPDKAELFLELNEEEQSSLLPNLTPEHSAEIFEEIDDQRAAELAQILTDDAVIKIVDEMDPDEAADLLGDIPPEMAQTVLEGIEAPEDILPLMIYPDDSAGGLMTSEFLVLRRNTSAQDAIEAIRHWSPDSEMIYYLFVVDRDKKLCGVVSLRELITASPKSKVGEIMNPDALSVSLETHQEEVARLLAHYDFLALPVVNSEGVLVGVVTVDDVIDVLEEESTEDIQRFGGTEPLHRPYLDTPVLEMARKRIGWLFLLFITATLTGSVMRLFEDELQAVIALAIFVPLLIGTGGNAGSQTTAIIIRSLATEDITAREALRVWWHEARVGLLLGLGMSIAAYVRAITWDTSTSLAITVAISTLGIVLWATGVGSLLPLLAARFGIDPALVSGPVMSTLVDATGLLIYFTIAGYIIGI
ncbi:MAG: magnesium transporter [Acidobacteriota bacterium]|nr:MAG: magnesium transporter [Acidobacteriota bacterium]